MVCTSVLVGAVPAAPRAQPRRAPPGAVPSDRAQSPRPRRGPGRSPALPRQDQTALQAHARPQERGGHREERIQVSSPSCIITSNGIHSHYFLLLATYSDFVS